MKKFMLTALVLILSATTIFFLFGRIDSAMEIDSLKEHIKLQRKEMHFLGNITNSALSSCKVSVIDFENLVRANGRDVLWQGDDGLVGGFKVTKRDSCIASITVANWL